MVEKRKEPSAVLMCEPAHFDVKDVKNPFMVGNVEKCDTALARRQWEDLRTTFEGLGYPVHIVEPVPDLEDMVFAANQVLPGCRADGSKYAVLASMVHASRRREVPLYANWFAKQGYELLTISDDMDKGPRFEGQGDAILHPGKNLIWGGFGHRTERAAYGRIAELTGAKVNLLELVNERFYHLDTAFCALDERTVLVYPAAFSSEGLASIRQGFDHVIELSEADASNFAGNALALGRHVVLQRGSTAACDAIRAAGFNPVEVDTSEFMKSGGSVFCLKMMVF